MCKILNGRKRRSALPTRNLTMYRKNENSKKGWLIALRTGRKNKHGQSLIEFSALILFILGALFVFQKYIVRGMAGRWKGVGDAISQGKIYDPEKTTECVFYRPLDSWYDRNCYENNCQSDCSPPSKPACEICIGICATPMCN